jgi:hypothetical protein
MPRSGDVGRTTLAWSRQARVGGAPSRDAEEDGALTGGPRLQFREFKFIQIIRILTTTKMDFPSSNNLNKNIVLKILKR